MIAKRLTLSALAGLPLVNPGDDLGALLIAALRRTEIVPRDKDVLVVAQKIVPGINCCRSRNQAF